MLLTLSEILLLNQRMSKYSSVEEEKAYYQTLAVLLERGSNVYWGRCHPDPLYIAVTQSLLPMSNIVF